jgi:hypothetical protein
LSVQEKFIRPVWEHRVAISKKPPPSLMGSSSGDLSMNLLILRKQREIYPVSADDEKTALMH